MSVKPVNVGISLGSSYARVTISSLVPSTSSSFSFNTSVLSNDLGDRYTPMVVCEENGNYVVGSAALKSTLRDKASSSNKGSVLPSASVLNNLNTPESNAFFAHLRDLAANASGLGLKSTDMLRVVLSVPDSTSEEKIGEIVKAVGSGFGKPSTILGVISEASAICCAHGMTGSYNENTPDTVSNWKTGVVLKWGTSGLTTTVVKRNGGSGAISVVSTSSNTDVGGEKFVDKMMEFCATQFKRKSGCDVWESKKAIAKLRLAAETAVRTLARGASANVEADGLVDGQDLRVAVSKPRWGMLARSIISAGKATMEECLAKAGGKVDAVLMSGSVLESPIVKEVVMEVFGEDVYTGVKGVAVDESISVGCSLHCALLVEAEVKGTNSLTATVKTANDVHIGIAKVSNGSIEGDVLPVITPGTLVGVECTGTLGGISKGGEVAVVNMGDNNSILAKVGDCEEGNLTVGLKLGEEGGLVVRVGEGVEITC